MSPMVAHDAVFNMLQDGDVREAITAYDAAIARWPANPKLLLLKGDVLARSAGKAEAAMYYAALLRNAATSEWAGKRLLALLRESVPTGSDAAAIARSVCEAPTDTSIRQAVLDLLLQRADPAGSASILEASANSGILRFESKLAVALTERGDFEAALAVLERAEREGRTSFHTTILRTDLLAACSRLPDAIALLEDMLRLHPEQADVHRRLTMLLQRAGDFTRAADVFEAAVRRWPHDWMLSYRLNRLPIPRDRLSGIFAVISGDTSEALKNDRFRFQFAIACLHVGEIERGIALLRQPFVHPVSILAVPVVAALSARSTSEWARSRLVDDRTKDVQIVRGENAQATILLTTGIAFGNLPLALIDALFADHDVNIVYLRDFGKRAYLRGIASLGSTEADTVSALQRIVADLGAPLTIAMGSSSGGFSALRYGALIGADVAVSFSGPTAMTSFFDSARPSAWSPDFFVRALMEREKDLPFDLVPLLQQPRRTTFLQFYGADSPGDAWQARRLEGLPGVTLTAFPGVSDHFVIDHMIGDGSFDALVTRLVAG